MLHVDHVDHTLPRNDPRAVRLACAFCNMLRKNALDAREVLLSVGSWWRERRRKYLLNWLHTSIDPVTGLGTGGRLYRNEHMERKFADLRAGGEE